MAYSIDYENYRYRGERFIGRDGLYSGVGSRDPAPEGLACQATLVHVGSREPTHGTLANQLRRLDPVGYGRDITPPFQSVKFQRRRA
jgi:hypothetical protein